MTGILWRVAGWTVGLAAALIVTAVGLYLFTVGALLLLRGTG